MTTLPAQLGNLGALPTYIACVHCLLGNLGALLAYTAYWAPLGEEVEGREAGSGFSHASHFSRSRQLESGQPHDYHEHQEELADGDDNDAGGEKFGLFFSWADTY